MLSAAPPSRTRNARVVALGSALAALVLLAGCGADPETAAEPASGTGSGAVTPSAEPTGPTEPTADSSAQPSGEPAPEPSRTPSSTPAAVPEILQFQATTVAGEPFDGAEVAGRPVVIWFWAPWCAVCRSQVPTVTGLAEQYGAEVAFLGVGSLDGAEAIAGFAADVPALTHLSDPDGALYERFGIAEQSSFVVLDPAGGEVLRTGYAEDDALAGTVAEIAG